MNCRVVVSVVLALVLTGCPKKNDAQSTSPTATGQSGAPANGGGGGSSSTTTPTGKSPAKLVLVGNPALDFGTTKVGALVEKTFTIKNDGQSDASGFDATQDRPFELKSTTCTDTIAASASCDVVVNFVGAVDAKKALKLAYFDGAAKAAVEIAQITGTATLDPLLDVAFDPKSGATVPLVNGSELWTGTTLTKNDQVLVAGFNGTADNIDFAVRRFVIFYTGDAGFGKNSLATADFGAQDLSLVSAPAPDNKVVVAGYSFTPANGKSAIAIARFNVNGTLDATFGNAGKVLTVVGTASAATAATVLPDGKILVSGYAFAGLTYDFLVARYNVDGTLDKTFGKDGIAITEVGRGNDYASGHLVLADGSIVVVGRTFNGRDFDMAAVLYDAKGAVLKKAAFDFGFQDLAHFVVAQADGKLLLVGRVYDGTTWITALARLNTDFTADAAFGTGGRVLLPKDVGTPQPVATYLADGANAIGLGQHVALKNGGATVFDSIRMSDGVYQRRTSSLQSGGSASRVGGFRRGNKLYLTTYNINGPVMIGPASLDFGGSVEVGVIIAGGY